MGYIWDIYGNSIYNFGFNIIQRYIGMSQVVSFSNNQFEKIGLRLPSMTSNLRKQTSNKQCDCYIWEIQAISTGL